MIHPVLFPDIDGVLASLAAVVLHRKQTYIPTAIEELNRFCMETSCLIAPISARLRLHPPEHFVQGLREAGFEGKFHPRLAVPRSWRPFSRSADLTKFMAEETIPLEAALIADDMPFHFTAAQRSRLIQPDPAVGFSEGNRIRAVELLSSSKAIPSPYMHRLTDHSLEPNIYVPHNGGSRSPYESLSTLEYPVSMSHENQASWKKLLEETLIEKPNTRGR